MGKVTDASTDTDLLEGTQSYFLSYDGIGAYTSIDSANHNWYIYMKDKFGVTTDGKLYANDAVIKGNLKAGKIGNSFNIDADSITATKNGAQIGLYVQDNGIALKSSAINTAMFEIKGNDIIITTYKLKQDGGGLYIK